MSDIIIEGVYGSPCFKEIQTIIPANTLKLYKVISIVQCIHSLYSHIHKICKDMCVFRKNVIMSLKSLVERQKEMNIQEKSNSIIIADITPSIGFIYSDLKIDFINAHVLY